MLNHARELSAKARAACARLIDAGIPMLSQTVLLRGLNDDADTLGELMRALVECRIKPYYLHHADFAPGTGHWRTGIAALAEIAAGAFAQSLLDLPCHQKALDFVAVDAIAVT